MRDLHDLQAAFGDLADRADTVPDPDSLIARRRSRERRRPVVLAPAAAALTTVAVVGGVLLISSGPSSNSDRNPAAGRTASASGAGVSDPLQPPHSPGRDSKPDLDFRFTADGPVGTTVAHDVDRSGQVLQFLRPTSGTKCPANSACVDTRQVAQVTLYYVKPAADPDEANFTVKKVVGRTAVEVDGHAGFYGHIPNSIDERESVYWQYAPGAWAKATAPTRSATLALAESVRPAHDVLIDIPVRPTLTGHEYLNIIDSERSRHGGSFEIATPGARTGGYIAKWGDVVTEYGTPPRENPQDVTVNDMRWTITGTTQPQATLQGTDVPISITADYGLSRAALRAYLARITVASDPSHRGTWFDAAAAFR